MKRPITYFLLGSFYFLPGLAAAKEITLLPLPATVDIPDMRGGWGISLEAAALRPYDNNLNYFLNNVITTGFDFSSNSYREMVTEISTLDPVYSLALRLEVNYTLEEKGNILRLFYEHFFDKKAESAIQDIPAFFNASANAREKLDGISLLSEQHILIGPYWETTLSIGGRFAHLGQEQNILGTHYIAGSPLNSTRVTKETFTAQFDGGGPLVGLGSIFLLTENIALGAEAQGALLIGTNDISALVTVDLLNESDAETNYRFNPNAIDPLYSIVPELFYRIYANYFYRFANETELQIEAGWRTNHFFNVRTYEQLPLITGGSSIVATNTQVLSSPFFDTTTNNDISFSGPYLKLNYKW